MGSIAPAEVRDRSARSAEARPAQAVHAVLQFALSGDVDFPPVESISSPRCVYQAHGRAIRT
jgi:hypothetical protein